MSAGTIARGLGLRGAGDAFTGNCPSCGHASGFTVTERDADRVGGRHNPVRDRGGAPRLRHCPDDKGSPGDEANYLGAGSNQAHDRVVRQCQGLQNLRLSVGSIDDLAQLLSELDHCPTTFVVRGRPAEGIDRHYAYRRLHPRTQSDGTIEPATIEPAEHPWIPLDLDSIPCPEWLDPVHEPARTVEYVVSQLPEEFDGVTCWGLFTSGQGIKLGIRMRLFFWADRALADWELKAWLGERVPTEGVPPAKWPRRYPVDLAIFAPAQPIYVARPVVVRGPDPVPIRSGIWRGDRDAITPP